MTQIPNWFSSTDDRAEEKINEIIDYLTAREELEDARQKDITSRLGVISKNQLEMKRGKRCLEEDFGFEPQDQPKRWPQKGDLIYCFNSRGDILEQRWNETDKQNGKRKFLGIFPTREAAEAYKARLRELGKEI